MSRRKPAAKQSKRLSSGLELMKDVSLEDDSDIENGGIEQKLESTPRNRNKLRASLSAKAQIAMLGEDAAPARRERVALSNTQLAKLYEDCMDLVNRNVRTDIYCFDVSFIPALSPSKFENSVIFSVLILR